MAERIGLSLILLSVLSKNARKRLAERVGFVEEISRNTNDHVRF